MFGLDWIRFSQGANTLKYLQLQSKVAEKKQTLYRNTSRYLDNWKKLILIIMFKLSNLVCAGFFSGFFGRTHYCCC